MRHRLCRTAIVFLAAAGLTAGAAAPQTSSDIERLTKEGSELSDKLELLFRRLPICDPAEERRQMEVWATKAGELKGVSLKPVGEIERLRLEDGGEMPVKVFRLEISGRDPYEKVHDFLIRIAGRPRLMDLETARLKAEADGTVSYAARFALFCYAPEEREVETSSAASVLAHYQGVHRKLTELIDRSDPRRLAAALGAFDRESGGALALTEVRSAEETVLEGVAVGKSAQALLERSLKEAGFRVETVRMSQLPELQPGQWLEARIAPSGKGLTAVELRGGGSDF